MKTILYLLTMCMTLSGCSQTKKQKNKAENTMNINTQTQAITAENVVDIMASQVKRYPSEPQYYLRINKNYCLVEILVNDYLVYNSYELANLATPHHITYAILKSGTQTLTYRLYPVEDLIKEQYNQGDTVTTLVDNTSLGISIIEVDNRSQKKMDDEKVIFTHTTKVNEDDNFIGTGKPYYEFTFEFEANVPYEIKGWTSGQDLSKIDSIALGKQVEKYYIEYKNLYLTKNKDEITRLRHDAIFGLCQSNYYSKERIQKMWDEIHAVIDNPIERQEPIENFKLEFYGNGKLVALRRKEIGNQRFRGQSALWVNYQSERGKRRQYLGLRLYSENISKGDALSFKVY